MTGGLEGTAALVTGGGSGIGLGCARRLLTDGAAVTICGRSEARLQGAVAELEALGAPGALSYAVADVTDEESVAAAVGRGARNRPARSMPSSRAPAAPRRSGPITQMDAEAWRRTIDLNVTGTMLTIKHAARPMAEARSRLDRGHLVDRQLAHPSVVRRVRRPGSPASTTSAGWPPTSSARAASASTRSGRAWSTPSWSRS